MSPPVAVESSIVGRGEIPSWSPALAAEDTADAIGAARDVGERLRNFQLVEHAAALAPEQTAFPLSTHWMPFTIAQGYAGLAILSANMDSCFPGEGWDVLGRSQLELAVRDAETALTPHLGLFSGLSGLALAAWTLSRQGTRYRRLLTKLDDAICPGVELLAQDLRSQRAGMTVGEFDVISGLSGIGAYLLCRRDQPAVARAWSAAVEALVEMTNEDEGLPRWHTPVLYQWDETMKKLYPHGNLNCGLAHGIPGPLAFLSLSLRAGSNVAGLAPSIARIAEWLSRNRYDDEWGVNWSTAVPIEEVDGSGGPPLRPAMATTAPDGPSRSAWCYGSPGIARALWLAGDALDSSEYRALAVSAMEAVFGRPIPERRIDSATFCHGVAGLLQIALRFAHDTQQPFFVEQSRLLVQQIMDQYRPESLLGFRNLETADHEIDQPGLLDGTPGVALVLLAASTAVEPAWDRLFLLS